MSGAAGSRIADIKSMKTASVQKLYYSIVQQSKITNYKLRPHQKVVNVVRKSGSGDTNMSIFAVQTKSRICQNIFRLR